MFYPFTVSLFSPICVVGIQMEETRSSGFVKLVIYDSFDNGDSRNLDRDGCDSGFGLIWLTYTHLPGGTEEKPRKVLSDRRIGFWTLDLPNATQLSSFFTATFARRFPAHFPSNVHTVSSTNNDWAHKKYSFIYSWLCVNKKGKSVPLQALGAQRVPES